MRTHADYDLSASGVVTLGGSNLTVGVMLGWPLWPGFLARFGPAFLVGVAWNVANA